MRDAQLRLRFKSNGTFFEGRIWAREVEQALERAPGRLLPGYLLAKFSNLSGVQISLDLDFDADPDGARTTLVDAITTALNPQPRTPLTKENILKWAQGVAGRFPTRNTSGWVEDKFVEIEVPRTVEWQLAQLLLCRNVRNWECYRLGELRETLSNLFYEGVMGYKDMSCQELLDRIWDGMCDPDQSPFDLNDLEDLLTELALSAGPGEGLIGT